MTDSPSSPPRLLEGTVMAFAPVPLTRLHHNGWSPMLQEYFIRALEAMGSVGQAARAVGMSRNSAYRLRERDGADEFAAAWDRALSLGKSRVFGYFMERALNGVTTITVKGQGAVEINGGMDFGLATSLMRGESPPPYRHK